MPNFLSKWLKIYRGEAGIFLWSTLLFFLIRSSNVIFDNYAETTFLKRFGVEYLPMIYMINAVVTFFIMGGLAGVMARLPGSRILAYTLVFCGASVAGLRFVVPLGVDLVYPVLFILKTQYEILLGLLFWDLANDLFNTRQSKRLFPLITAGGVLGGVIGSFGTPFIAKAFTLDNLMFAYLGVSLMAAASVGGMSAHYPSAVLAEQQRPEKRRGSSMIGELQKIIPLMKESSLLRVLVALTLIPNVVIPILNYQFNFAVNETFATEGKMLAFFGYFRGFLNVVSFVILLFVGRVYGRWGLPVALMFHPFNYIAAFLAFFFRFDVFSAMYARVSTTVLRTTINNPARAVLVGLFPASYRNVVRPFLRGTVVRVGILIGSGIIIALEGVVSPASLSLVAIFFVSVWLFSTFVLKKRYSDILLDLISRDMLDLKSMEREDVGQIFRDKKMRSQLIQDCMSAEGDECVWYASLLNSVEEEELDAHLLSMIKEKDDRTRIGLLSFLTPRAGSQAIPVLRALADPDKKELTTAVAKAASRLPLEASSEFLTRLYEQIPIPEVKAYAVKGLFRTDPSRYGKTIEDWLRSDHVPERRAGVIAAGQSGDSRYVEKLKALLGTEEDGSILPHILQSLHLLGASDMNGLALPFLSHDLESVRHAALSAYEIEKEEDLRRVVDLLNDPSERIHDLAKEKIDAAPYQNAQVLVESLAYPRRRVREGIFYLLESMNVKELEVSRFARRQLEKAYRSLAESEAVRRLPESPARDLLIAHLEQKRAVGLENILRVLASQDRSGQMRVVWRGVYSSDARQRSNSLEALEDLLENSLSKIMMPLLENLSPSQSLDLGRKKFPLPRFDSNRAFLFSELLTGEDWLTSVLTLYLLSSLGPDGASRETLEQLAASENQYVRRQAASVLGAHWGAAGEKENEMKTDMTMPDKILHLKGIQIFEDLSISELAAVASITEEVVYPAGETVIREGEPGETMYLVIKGEVAVIKSRGEGREIELDRIREGDYFGEMALFEDVQRSASIRTVVESHLLVLNKQEFTEIVREYPQIALHICKVLSQRIRRLHGKIQSYEKASAKAADA